MKLGNKKTKILIGVGAVTAVTVPLVVMASCGVFSKDKKADVVKKPDVIMNESETPKASDYPITFTGRRELGTTTLPTISKDKNFTVGVKDGSKLSGLDNGDKVILTFTAKDGFIFNVNIFMKNQKTVDVEYTVHGLKDYIKIDDMYINSEIIEEQLDKHTAGSSVTLELPDKSVLTKMMDKTDLDGFHFTWDGGNTAPKTGVTEGMKIKLYYVAEPGFRFENSNGDLVKSLFIEHTTRWSTP